MNSTVKDGGMNNYSVKSYVDQHRIDVFSHIYVFPIDVTYMCKVLSKTSLE